MNSLNAIKALNDVSAYQRGMFTSAQAKRLGVQRYTLARLENGGSIERILRGVYRMGGAPSIREEDIYATWLSLDPNREPGVPRPADSVPIAMAATAAWLQELGEIGPRPLEFCCAKRIQTQRANLTIHKRKLNPSEITNVNGIPATSAAMTILDLVDGGEDLSLISNVLADAFERGLIRDEKALRKELDQRSAKSGLPRDTSLYDLLAKGNDI